MFSSIYNLAKATASATTTATGYLFNKSAETPEDTAQTTTAQAQNSLTSAAAQSIDQNLNQREVAIQKEKAPITVTTCYWNKFNTDDRAWDEKTIQAYIIDGTGLSADKLNILERNKNAKEKSACTVMTIDALQISSNGYKKLHALMNNAETHKVVVGRLIKLINDNQQLTQVDLRGLNLNTDDIYEILSKVSTHDNLKGVIFHDQFGHMYADIEKTDSHKVDLKQCKSFIDKISASTFIHLIAFEAQLTIEATNTQDYKDWQFENIGSEGKYCAIWSKVAIKKKLEMLQRIEAQRYRSVNISASTPIYTTSSASSSSTSKPAQRPSMPIQLASLSTTSTATSSNNDDLMQKLLAESSNLATQMKKMSNLLNS